MWVAHMNVWSIFLMEHPCWANTVFRLKSVFSSRKMWWHLGPDYTAQILW